MLDLPLEPVRTLLVAVDGGTFEAAARALHVTPSAVSQRIKLLEGRTGRVLLERTKPLRPTESGQVVLRLARQLARLEHDVEAELGLDGGQGPAQVSVAVNADSLSTWFLPAVASLAREAIVSLDLRREDEAHTARLLREGTVMAAVTSSARVVPGCSLRRLGTMHYRAVASPQFRATWLPAGSGGQALGRAPVVVFDRKDDLQDAYARRQRVRGGVSGPRHHVPSSEAFLDAVAAGFGWGLVPQVQAAPRVAAGELVELDPGRPLGVPLYWQQWKLDSPALARVADAVARGARAALATR